MNPAPTPWSEYLQRNASGLTKAALARKLGQNDATVGRWLNGSTPRPDADTIVSIARILGQSPVFALIAIGYIAADDLANPGPPRSYGLNQYTDLELAQEIVRRIEEAEASDLPLSVDVGGEAQDDYDAVAQARTGEDETDEGFN